MKKIILILFVALQFIGSLETNAQNKSSVKAEKLEKPYKPEENAQKKIDALLVKAKKENKNIILQAGGNWCIWCLRFNDFMNKTADVNKIIKKNFLYYHLNFSTENKNEVVFDKYAPEGKKLGYPFFIVLDKNGKVLKLQESGSLESGKGYDKTKVLSFLNTWKTK